MKINVEKILFYISCALAVVLFLGLGFLMLRPVVFAGSRDRWLKDFTADVRGGLKRTVTVYSYSGAPIKQWQGKIDLSASTNEVNMIIDNDKRVIIQGGVVVVEEQ